MTLPFFISSSMRVLLAGGGTLGSVTPLLAVTENLKETFGEKNVSFLWIGTRKGPEKEFAERAGLPFRSIHGGKLRRYFDVRNFIDPFFILMGVAEASYHVLRFRPDVVLNAGSYIGVPVVLAAWFFRVRVLLLQLDVAPSLSNLLVSRCADAIGASFEESMSFFSKKKTTYIGMPVRKSVSEWQKRAKSPSERNAVRKKWNIANDLPLLLILGGGTGASALNRLVWDTIEQLAQKMNVVHVTGKEKMSAGLFHDRYRAVELLGDELIPLMACSDIVVTRAGLGTLSELAFLGIPSIVVPLPDSHQEKNAEIFERRGACVFVAQKYLENNLPTAVNSLLANSEKRKKLSENMQKVFPLDWGERIRGIM